jgi:HSP20 family molecular chaperone IbpA
MSSPARGLKGTSNSEPTKPEILSYDEARKFLDGFNDLVSRRAYELFERDGQMDGNDVAHWLQAEQELASSLPEVRESADSFSTHFRVLDAAAGGVKVYATEDRAIIFLENTSQKDSDDLYESSEATYYMVRWPEIVDPATCRAELDEDVLSITVRKAGTESRTGTESSEGL